MKAFRSLFLGAILCAAGALASSTATAQLRDQEHPEPRVEVTQPTSATSFTATAAEHIEASVRLTTQAYQLNEAAIIQVFRIERALESGAISRLQAEAEVADIVARSKKNTQLRSRQPSNAVGSSASLARRRPRVVYC